MKESCVVAKMENIIITPSKNKNRRKLAGGAIKKGRKPPRVVSSKMRNRKEIISAPRLALNTENSRTLQERSRRACTNCGKVFNRADHANRHMRDNCPVVKRKSAVRPLSVDRQQSERPQVDEEQSKNDQDPQTASETTSHLPPADCKFYDVSIGPADQLVSPEPTQLENSARTKKRPSLVSRPNGERLWISRWGKMFGPPWVCPCGSKYGHQAAFAKHKRLRCVLEKAVSDKVGSIVPVLSAPESLQRPEMVSSESQHCSESVPICENTRQKEDELHEVSVANSRKCPCGEVIRSTQDLYKHLFKCPSIREPVCVCGARLAHWHSLMRHIRNIHNVEGLSGAAKSKSGKTGTPKSRTKPKVNLGAASHRVTYACASGKSFETESQLVSHTKSGCCLDLLCALCQKEYTQKQDLYAHIVKAHRVKPETLRPFRPEDLDRTNDPVGSVPPSYVPP